MRTTVRHAHRVDTDKLHLIAAAQHADRSDFARWEETLYRGKTNYILVGKGGAHSKYGERCRSPYGCGSIYVPGERVTVLTEDQAREWLLIHDPEKAAEQFPDLAEDA